MFEAVVAELQKLGAHLADALRIANQIDLESVPPYGMSHKEWEASIPLGAKEVALQTWQNERDAISKQ